MSHDRSVVPSQVDVVIVGAGITGLAAAAWCAEHQVRAVLLEKQPEIGGTSAMSGGWFAFSGTDEQRRRGIVDHDSTFVADMLAASGGVADPALLEAYAREQHDAYDWMRGLGLEFDVVKLSSGQSVPRSHRVPIGTVLAALLARVEAASTVVLRTGARVVDLIDDGGTVAGVVVELDGGTRQRVHARGVLLGTGGFTRSPETIGRYAPRQVDAMPYGGLGNTGDGLRFATARGAALRDMEYVSGTFGSHPETTIEEHELLTAFYMGAVIVNVEGRRFVDESASYKTLGAACLEQPRQIAFQVFDADVRAQSQPGVPLSDIDALEDKGHVHRADSLRELAGAAGIDAAELERTVREYNAVVAGDRSDAFGRTGLCNGVGRLVPVAKAPFYAYPAKTLMTSTYCGVAVDAVGRVLTESGAAVPGLYAAGEVVGGFHGKAYVTGTALSKGLIFGRVAASHIAMEAAAR